MGGWGGAGGAGGHVLIFIDSALLWHSDPIIFKWSQRQKLASVSVFSRKLNELNCGWMDTTEMMIMVIMVMALPTFPLPFDAAWTLCNLAKFPSQIKKKKKKERKNPSLATEQTKKKICKRNGGKRILGVEPICWRGWFVTHGSWCCCFWVELSVPRSTDVAARSLRHQSQRNRNFQKI